MIEEKMEDEVGAKLGFYLLLPFCISFWKAVVNHDLCLMTDQRSLLLDGL